MSCLGDRRTTLVRGLALRLVGGKIEPHELLRTVAGREMVGGVLTGTRLDDTQGAYHVSQSLIYHGGMLATGLVPVGHDDHVGAGERLVVLGSPLAGAACVTGRGTSGALKRLDVLLALADVDRLASLHSLEHFREPVQHASHAVELPLPPLAFGPPLAKRLGLKADHLIEQLT